MGLGLGIIIVLFVGALLGFLVVQAKFAARKWREVIADGDLVALGELLDSTFQGWRATRPSRGASPAVWRAQHSVTLVAADTDRVRVALIAEPDVRVEQGERVEVGSILDVARRAAVRMAEQLLYEVPHVHFVEAQIDVHTDYRDRDGSAGLACVLTTRVTREAASVADWEGGNSESIVQGWRTRERGTLDLDPELGALISADELEVVTSALAAAG